MLVSNVNLGSFGTSLACCAFLVECIITGLIHYTSCQLSTGLLWGDDKRIMTSLKIQIFLYVTYAGLLLFWVMLIKGLEIQLFIFWFVIVFPMRDTG